MTKPAWPPRVGGKYRGKSGKPRIVAQLRPGSFEGFSRVVWKHEVGVRVGSCFADSWQDWVREEIADE